MKRQNFMKPHLKPQRVQDRASLYEPRVSDNTVNEVMLISFLFLQEWKKPLGCDSAGNKDQASALLWLPARISKDPSQHAVPKGRGWVARLLGNLSLSQYPHLPPVGHCWVLGEAPQRRWCWWWARCSYAAARAECCSDSVSSVRRGSPGLLPGSEATNKTINENIMVYFVASPCIC